MKIMNFNSDLNVTVVYEIVKKTTKKLTDYFSTFGILVKTSYF
jgi:hypothetical protein